MGRIKTTQIKRTGRKLMELHKDKFSKDFEHNKQVVTEVSDIPSKKLRNITAGYLTRLVKKHKEA